METFVEEPLHQNLALLNAEKRKLSSLRNMHLPWVFVEPTRIKSVKIPKKPQRNNTFNDFDDEDLEFLGRSKIPFTQEDLEILQNSLHGEKLSAPKHSQEFEDAFNEIKQKHENERLQLNIKEEVIEKEPVLPDEDEEIVSARSNNSAIDDLFASDDENVKMMHNEENEAHVEPETVKNIIMEAVHERETANKKESPKQIKLFSFDIPNANETKPDSNNVAKEKPSKGRKKLIEAINKSSSLNNEEDSLTYASKKIQSESHFKNAALDKCFAAKHFKDYLEKKNLPVPQNLSKIDFSEVKNSNDKTTNNVNDKYSKAANEKTTRNPRERTRKVGK